MCAHYLFDPDFCNRQRLGEGRVEKNVQDSRRRIWVEAGQRRFGSFAELNAWLGERCRALWRAAPPAAQSVQHRRDAGAGAKPPDAHAGGL
jgi:hypothetical protein